MLFCTLVVETGLNKYIGFLFFKEKSNAIWSGLG